MTSQRRPPLKQIRIWLRHKKTKELQKMLASLDPADIADLVRRLTLEQGSYVFHLLTPDCAVEVFHELRLFLDQDFLRQINEEKLSTVLESMPADEAADIVAELPQPQAERVLSLMEEEESDDVRELLIYKEDTAGGRMTTDFVSLHEDWNVQEALNTLRSVGDRASAYYVYVTDKRNRLVGVLPLRRLITADPTRRLADIMQPSVVSVRTDTDQEEVAKIAARHDLTAVPVVDKFHTLVGVVTADDLMDVMQEEASEDISHLGGTDDEELDKRSVFKVARIRLPWLITCLVGGLTSAWILKTFQPTLGEFLGLVVFIPIIMGMGGNVGTQSSTMTVRRLATGRLDLSQLRRVLFREIRIGTVIGSCCGTVVGVVAWVAFGEPFLGIAVGLAMVIALTVAATAGLLVPTTFKKLRADPAIASGPFITTLTDITGLLIYFAVATGLLQVRG